MNVDLDPADKFYDKIRDKKKLTSAEFSTLQHHRNVLSQVKRKGDLQGRALKALEYYLKRFDNIYAKQTVKAEVNNKDTIKFQPS